MTKDVVRVVFRKDTDGDIFALFPFEQADDSGNCVYYVHIGQHGAANYAHCITTSSPATCNEYSALAEELKQIGYQLQIRTRKGMHP